MENYRLALSRTTSIPLSTESSPHTIHSLHIIKNSPITPRSAAIPPLVIEACDAKPEPPPIRESALVHLQRMKYTFSFESRHTCAWKVAKFNRASAFRTALRVPRACRHRLWNARQRGYRNDVTTEATAPRNTHKHMRRRR